MSGPQTTINQYNFYMDYIWSPTDFANLQGWLQAEYRGIALGFTGNQAAVLQGCLCSPDGGLNVTVGSGICVDSNGRISVVTGGTASLSSPSGNPANSLIVIRPTLTDLNQIPEPDSPLTNVPLYEGLTYSIVVINGTPGATPSYPSTQANDIVIAGLLIPAAATTITQSMFDFTQCSLSQGRRHVYNYQSSAYSVLSTDDFVDLDGTSAAFSATLPPSYTVPGQVFIFCKVDAVNTVTVAAQGSDLISGQASWDLTDQWATLKVLSVGNGYRVV